MLVGRDKLGRDCMPRLVVGGEFLFLLGDRLCLFLRTDDHLEHRVLDVVHADERLLAPRGEQRRLVQEVGEVCTGEADRGLGNRGEVHITLKRLALGMNM